MRNLNKNRSTFHGIIEKDARMIKFGTISYTIFVGEDGEPQIKTLKVNKSKRIKY
jgi:hypothetical protein